MVYLEWKDIQLKFEYLKNNSDQNFFNSTGKLWTPNLEFFHKKKYHYDFNPKYSIIKNMSTPILSGDTDEINVREVYSGEDFTLFMKMKKTSEYYCSFDNINNYPFGEQKCIFGFYIKFPASQFTELIPFSFNGTTNPIGQYMVKEWIYETFQRDEEKGILVTLVLERDLASS